MVLAAAACDDDDDAVANSDGAATVPIAGDLVS